MRTHVVLALWACFIALSAGCEEGIESSGGSAQGGAAGGDAGGGGTGGGCTEGSPDEGGACVTALGAWQPAPSLAHARDHHATFVAESEAGPHLYVLGGVVDMEAPVPEIERAPILEDGSLGSFETIGALTTLGPGVAQAGSRVLIAGGIRSNAGPSAQTDLGTVQADGSISFEDGPPLSSPRFHVALATASDHVYVVGGIQADGTSQASVERATFTQAGLGSWELDTPLPEPRSHHALVAHDGALYVIGGLNRFDGDPFPYEDANFSDVLRSEIGADGSLGSWTVVGQLPSPLAVHAAFAHDGALYLTFGLEGTSDTGDFIGRVQRAPLNADGTVGTFESLPDELPIARAHTHQAPLFEGVVYSAGGASFDGLHMMSQAEAFFARFE
jgi:hypothetical protein